MLATGCAVAHPTCTRQTMACLVVLSLATVPAHGELVAAIAVRRLLQATGWRLFYKTRSRMWSYLSAILLRPARMARAVAPVQHRIASRRPASYSPLAPPCACEDSASHGTEPKTLIHSRAFLPQPPCNTGSGLVGQCAAQLRWTAHARPQPSTRTELTPTPPPARPIARLEYSMCMVGALLQG